MTMPNDNLILPAQAPSRSDAVKNRALLLRTAVRLFNESGVEVVSMSAIAEAAGVGKGTLYRHFQNKIELCQALLDEDQRDLQERTLDRIRTALHPGAILRWFLAEAAAFVERNQALLCAGTGGLVTLEHPAHWWWRQTIRGLLVRLDLPGDVDYLTDALYILLDVYTIRFLLTARGYTLPRIVDGLHALCDALGVPQA
jgi:AcrR family transcriptional regulator